ncbi:integrase [Helicobacter sp. 12S02634-8]|uniref:tyrosine-type recombinase/integrase n=1 Tax=Helicobacter sp. 12S02634-8 TaxID=1476199 RepID=UPI000BA5632A|nr:tyrosine-type recombinase/integrase [Helicobacter sp. 12S02634-8]PAF48471.1 integrase [Helicobacter sp. 12S02634-8]
MYFNLESGEGFLGDLLFWSARFIRYKLITLSNSKVKGKKDKKCVQNCLQALHTSPKNIQELEKICKEARNAGLLGVNTYANPILKFYSFMQSFCERYHSIKEIDEEILAEFLVSQTGGLSLASKKNYRIALLGLFGYIDKQNRDKNGLSHTYNIELKHISGTRGKSGQKLPAYLNTDELEKFLGGIDTLELSAKVRARDRLIVKMIVYTGIRVSEALHLRAKDITLDKDLYLLHIKGKGDKYRVVMIRACHIQSLLEEWLMLRSMIEVTDNLLFCNQKGGALTQAYLYRYVEKILQSVGIQKEKKGPHMLRHSFATLLYQKRHDLLLVQEALGHADLNTSRIYTHFDKNRLMEAASIMEDLKPHTPQDTQDTQE